MNRFEMVMAELRRVWPMDAKVISDHIAARDATITQLRAELERVKGLVEARGSVWIDREAFDAVVADELPYDTTLWPALQRKFGEGHQDQVRVVAIPREPTQAMLDAVGPGADALKRRIWHGMYDAATARADELRSVVDGAGGEG